MPILIRYAPSSLTREQYDKVNEILQENGPDGPPAPLQLHVLFGEGPSFRVSEIWASEDAWQQAGTAASRPRCPRPASSSPSPRSSRSTRSGAAASRNSGRSGFGGGGSPCALRDRLTVALRVAGQVLDSKCMNVHAAGARRRASIVASAGRPGPPSGTGDLLVAALLLVARGRSAAPRWPPTPPRHPRPSRARRRPGRRSPSPRPGRPPSPRRARCRCSWPDLRRPTSHPLDSR